MCWLWAPGQFEGYKWLMTWMHKTVNHKICAHLCHSMHFSSWSSSKIWTILILNESSLDSKYFDKTHEIHFLYILSVCVMASTTLPHTVENCIALAMKILNCVIINTIYMLFQMNCRGTIRKIKHISYLLENIKVFGHETWTRECTAKLNL